MKRYMSIAVGLILLPFLLGNEGCEGRPSSDQIQRQQQEQLLKDATSSLGMPNMHNWREKRVLKSILELRDQKGILTYTYIYSQYRGKFTCVNVSTGYPIPYATQYTNPQKIEYDSAHGFAILPQADPNGLFSPAAADATWVLMKNTNSSDIEAAYMEDKIDVFPFKLRPEIVDIDCPDKMAIDASEKIKEK